MQMDYMLAWTVCGTRMQWFAVLAPNTALADLPVGAEQLEKEPGIYYLNLGCELNAAAASGRLKMVRSAIWGLQVMAGQLSKITGVLEILTEVRRRHAGRCAQFVALVPERQTAFAGPPSLPPVCTPACLPCCAVLTCQAVMHDVHGM
jgi:hypothetical protein